MTQVSNIKFYAPADENVWTQALPLGNGSLGAMVYNTVPCEHLQLNQESVWSAYYRDRVNPEAHSSLHSVREQIFSEELEAAEQSVYEHILNPFVRMGNYEPLCDLRIHTQRKIPHYSEMFSPPAQELTDYERTLDFRNALLQCSYQKENIHYTREAFISYPDQVLAVKMTADAPISMRIELSRENTCESVLADGPYLTLYGGGGCHPKFMAMLYAQTDAAGKIHGSGDCLVIDNAMKLILYLTARTDFYEDSPNISSWCSKKLEQAVSLGYDAVLDRHLADMHSLYDRMEIGLPDSENEEDVLRYFNYGRYLMIASSRPGSLPSNLQGLWNHDMHPSWGSGYTLNINLEMNYWPVETANLAECHMPLMSLIRRMLPHAKETALRLYHCRGAVAFHNTDIYGDCAPHESWMPASVWPMGYAWICLHIIEHYRYSQDYSFAEEYFDVLEESSLFFADFLIPDHEGYLVTCPSTSPENTYITSGGHMGTVCYGPAMDIQIIRELWGGLMEIAGKLGRMDTPVVQKVSALISLLPKEKIGTMGQLLEWQKEYKEWEPGHRHISHLFGLYPGSSIDKDSTPALADAAEITLQRRLAGGGGQVGWSRAWLINLYARLGKSEEAYEHLLELIHTLSAENLFDLHPALAPGMPSVFQIDGNFGGCAGVMEMIVQSQNGVVRLLPALPDAWKKTGHVRGIRCRGGIELDFQWKDGIVTDYHLRNTDGRDHDVTIEMNGKRTNIHVSEMTDY